MADVELESIEAGMESCHIFKALCKLRLSTENPIACQAVR